MKKTTKINTLKKIILTAIVYSISDAPDYYILWHQK